MKKTRIAVVLILAFVFVLTFTFTAMAESEPSVTASGVSIRIPEDNTVGGLRFKTTVALPLPEGIEITAQGTLIIPFYVNGENDITLDTKGVLNVPKTQNKYYTYEDSYYEYTAVLTGIPVYHLNSLICARSYMTYTVDGGEEQTVYSDIVIHDIHSIAERIMASSTEKEETKVAVKEFIIDSYDEYISNVGGNEEGLLAVTSPLAGETVYPYDDQAKSYLLAGEELEGDIDISTGNYVKVGSHSLVYTLDPAKPIEISWSNAYENVASYTVVYATKSDFSDAKYAHAAADGNSVELYNLYKASDYYVKIIANLKDGSTRSVTSTFKTADLGPRVIHLDGSYNARDLGGYMTSSGKRTLQGLMYRSGQMDNTYWNGSKNYNTTLSAYGKYTASKELGIIVDFDFRGSAYPAAFPGATHIYVGVGGYDIASASNQEKIRQAFSIFANVNNYPMIFHCQGGADRTGTIAYLFNALLGVSELDVVRDYEFTTFSVYGNRAIDSTYYMAKPDYNFYTTLDAQKGDTLQERVENFLLSIGVTAEEISNIKSIMFTGKVQRKVTLPTELKLAESTELKIEINGSLDELSAVYVGGESVEWHKTAGGIAVNVIDFPQSVTDGNVSVKVIFTDGEEPEGVFAYDSTRTITASDSVSKTFDLPLNVTVGAVLDHIDKVYVNNAEVNFTLTETGITVPFTSITGLTGGTYTVKVVFIDGEELTDTFIYDAAEVVYVEDYIAQTTLNSSLTSASSLPVGYGKWVRIRLDATSISTGDIRVLIGSYGVKLRGGNTRYHTFNTSGTLALDARPAGHSISQTIVAKGNNVYLYMKVDLVDDTTFNVSIVTTDRTTGEVKASQSYSDTRLTSGEYTDANAAVTFMIGASDTTELVIYGGEEINASATLSLADIIDFGDAEYILLDEVGDTVVSSPVGYGNWVKIHCDNVNTEGDNNIYIGSYGIRLRSGLRVYTYSASGVSTEIARNLATLNADDYLNNKYDVYMKVDLVSDTVARLSFKAYNTGTDTLVLAEESYDITRLTSDEVSTENACMTIKIGAQDKSTTYIKIYKD